MDRYRNPVWSQYQPAIEAVLEPLGFKLSAEASHYATFGSASAEYERSDAKVELFWDGKENWLDVHVATRDRNERHCWGPRRALLVDPPASNIRAHVLRTGQIADEYLVNVLSALRKAFDMPPNQSLERPRDR
jgi:hypothetical protein